MLQRDPNIRATLDDLLDNTWVTNNFTETIKLQEVEVFKHGFGNINKLMKYKLTQGKTVCLESLNIPKPMGSNNFGKLDSIYE